VALDHLVGRVRLYVSKRGSWWVWAIQDKTRQHSGQWAVWVSVFEGR
jgi:hypothetical protein